MRVQGEAKLGTGYWPFGGISNERHLLSLNQNLPNFESAGDPAVPPPHIACTIAAFLFLLLACLIPMIPPPAGWELFCSSGCLTYGSDVDSDLGTRYLRTCCPRGPIIQHCQ